MPGGFLVHLNMNPLVKEHIAMYVLVGLRLRRGRRYNREVQILLAIPLPLPLSVFQPNPICRTYPFDQSNCLKNGKGSGSGGGS